MSLSKEQYWSFNIKIILIHLAIGFIVSFGCGILWVDWLNQFSIGGFKLGFWFAQQGSVFAFVILIFSYAMIMNHLDKKLETRAPSIPIIE